MNKNTDTYKTNSFYIAAFLYAKGLRLIDVDKSQDPRKAFFVFVDNGQRKIILEKFNFGLENDPDVLVDARKFVEATKVLKEKIYQF